MKYRSDFVTNSSSSSFIIIFKNKADKESAYIDMLKRYPYHATRVFADIEENKKTYAEILKYYSEMIEWSVYCDLKYNSPEYKNRSYDWYRGAEFNKIVKKAAKKEIENFKNSVNHRGYFSIVNYSDHTDSDLEHEIMPYMPFTYKTINNH